MKIWIDADACPNVIKEILFRAATRTKTMLILVANQPLRTPPSPFIKSIVVSSGFDVADNYIAKNMAADDLVITADIPLADAVIENGGTALNPRGELYTPDNIKQRLSIRNFNEAVRSSGIQTGGPAVISKRDLQTFANTLDKMLTQRKKSL